MAATHFAALKRALSSNDVKALSARPYKIQSPQKIYAGSMPSTMGSHVLLEACRSHAVLEVCRSHAVVYKV